MKPRLLLFTLVTFLGVGGLAHAGTYTFSFTNMTYQGVNNSTNNDAAIATYMDNIIGCSNCVTVTGAAIDEKYNADGNVVGPCTGAGCSDTLGTTSGITTGLSNSSTYSTTQNTFLATTTDNGTNISSEITIAIAGVTISSVSFDYEIFPDASCTYLNNWGCGGGGTYNPNDPSFEFGTGTGNTLDSNFGTGGKVIAGAPSSSPSYDGGSTRAPAGNPEKAPQYIGYASGISVPNASQLDFIDWPATIGISNLSVTYTGTPVGMQGTVPEPSSVLLLATASIGVVIALRRKFSALS